MCGIFAYLLAKNNKTTFPLELRRKLLRNFSNTQHRGPDNSIFKTVNKNLCLGFHRLCINDTSDKGNQPFEVSTIPGVFLVCNGEIYNYQTLCDENGFEMDSSSDCEVILHMFNKYGIDRTVRELDGVFAFVLYDSNSGDLYAARDPFGVRSLYRGTTIDGNVIYGSELKSVNSLCLNVEPFTPGTWAKNNEFHTYYNYEYSPDNFPLFNSLNEEKVQQQVRYLLEKAVKKRLMSERPIGCLLSGGLDSSLVTAMVAQHYPRGTLKTFSIGLEGSEDLKFARLVAAHLGTDHHEIVVTEQQMLDTLNKDIWMIETFDTTTIRASTPMLLMSEYIKEQTDVTVVYSGEGSDEASGSYLYFHNAPSHVEFQDECVRLLKDLHYFDVLRCDKSTAGAGLEVRVPFLDKEFLDFYMSIPPALKVPRNGVEKYLLRKAFESSGYLPDSVLWRQKEGFSDGCSSKKKSWYSIIQDYVDTIITDKEFEENSKEYEHSPPLFKEAYYYRKKFGEYYPNCDECVPYYWIPKWSGDIVEPSARVLNVYETEKDDVVRPEEIVCEI